MQIFPSLKAKHLSLTEKKYLPYCNSSSQTKLFLPSTTITTPKHQDSESNLKLKKFASHLFVLPLPSNSIPIKKRQKSPSINNKLLRSRLISHRNSEQSIKSESIFQTERKVSGFSEIKIGSEVFQTPLKLERKGFQSSAYKIRMLGIYKSGASNKKRCRYIDHTVPQSICIVSKIHREGYFD